MASGRRKTIVLAALLIGVTGPLQAQTGARAVTLDEALGLAIGNNRDVEASRLELETAKQQVREAWSSVFPTLDLDLSYTRNLSVSSNFLPAIIFDPTADPDELIPVKFGADNIWNLQLRAEQPLFKASAFVGVGAAGRYQSLQREVVRGQVIDVATRVKLAYYAALLADESVRLSENSVRRVRQSLDETRKMFEAGMSSSYDVLRLEVELANLEPNLRRARNAALAAKRSLSVELAVTGVDSLEVVGTLRDVDPDEPIVADVNGGLTRFASMGSRASQRSVDDLIAMARENRSDLRQLRLTESLRRTELKVERAEYMPTVSLFGTYSIAAQQNGRPDFFGEDGRNRAYGRQVGVTVSLPIFAGFRRPARTAQRETAIQQVRTQTALLSDQIESSVRSLYEDVEEAHSRARAQKFAIAQAQRGYEIARAQYREGIGSQLELTDAEVALRQSEFNYAEAIHDWLTAEARLDQAVGIVPEIENAGSLALGVQ